jgi:hypothetical protein
MTGLNLTHLFESTIGLRSLSKANNCYVVERIMTFFELRNVYKIQDHVLLS